MRIIILAAASVVALTAFGAVPAQAVGARYPFCIQGDQYPGLSNCTYETFQQCQAAASGIALTCIANPYYAGDNDRRSYLNIPQRQLDRDDRGLLGLFIR